MNSTKIRHIEGQHAKRGLEAYTRLCRGLHIEDREDGLGSDINTLQPITY